MYLTKNLSMDLTGKVLIARYGKIFRGSKVNIQAFYHEIYTGVIIKASVMSRFRNMVM